MGSSPGPFFFPGPDLEPVVLDRSVGEKTAAALADAIRTRPEPLDLILFSNEAADTGDYQVGVRVAYALGLPCVAGIKGIAIEEGRLTAQREAAGSREIFDVTLPAVVTVKEGINLPRYASLPGRLRAKKTPIEHVEPRRRASGLETIRLVVPPERPSHVEILGRGADAAPRVVEILHDLGLVAS